MLIDWFTVCAQTLNFLILAWLLKQFLYKPILQAIDAREKRIATELGDADAKKAEATKEREDFSHKNEEFDKQRAELLAKATSDANTERQRLFDDGRNAADAFNTQRQESLRNDITRLNQTLRLQTQREVFAIARKTLTDLATTSLEERISEVFTRRLREMGNTAKNSLGDALKAATTPALLRSTFDLSESQRATIHNALNETFSADIHLQFEITPDLIGGIELATNGQKLAWTISDYLASLEESVAELLQINAKSAPHPVTTPESQTNSHQENIKPDTKGQ